MLMVRYEVKKHLEFEIHSPISAHLFRNIDETSTQLLQALAPSYNPRPHHPLLSGPKTFSLMVPSLPLRRLEVALWYVCAHLLNS